MKVIYTTKFVKSFKRLPIRIQNLTKEKDKLFRDSPLNPSLKTHQLIGRFSGWHAFSINYQYRVIFLWKGDKAIFLNIGTHGIYK